MRDARDDDEQPAEEREQRPVDAREHLARAGARGDHQRRGRAHRGAGERDAGEREHREQRERAERP